MRKSQALPVVCLIAASFLGSAGVSAAELPPRQREQIDAAVRREMDRLGIPAISVAIARGGDVAYSQAWGLADLEQRVAATPATRYRTASVAKTLTATAAMRLVEQGRLDLDAPIQRYCRAFPEKPWPVTARQLLVHTAGIRHYARRGESSGTEHFFTVGDALRPFAADPLLFEPGSQLGYSTYGYVVLGCALEGAAAKPYDALMAELVYEPAGMERTGPDHHYMLIPDRARGYERMSEHDHGRLPPAIQQLVRPGHLFNAPLHDTSMKRPGGGLLSTAEDLARFAVAFAAGKIVAADTVAKMWTVQATRDGKPLETPWGPLGIGWFVRSAGGRRELYGSGGQVGGRSSLYVYPDDGVVLAVAANLTDADLVPLEREILRLLIPNLPDPAAAGADANP